MASLAAILEIRSTTRRSQVGPPRVVVGLDLGRRAASRFSANLGTKMRLNSVRTESLSGTINNS